MKKNLTLFILLTFLVSTFLLFTNLTLFRDSGISTERKLYDLTNIEENSLDPLVEGLDFYGMSVEDQISLTIPFEKVVYGLIYPQLNDALEENKEDLKQNNRILGAKKSVGDLFKCKNEKPWRRYVFGLDRVVYNLNLTPDSFSFETLSGETNKLKITIDAKNAEITTGITYKKFKCGVLKKSKRLDASMKGIKLSAVLNVSIDGTSGISIDSYTNEKIEYIGTPNFIGDFSIIEGLLSFLSEKIFGFLNCDSSETCLLNLLLPLLEDELDWDTKLDDFLKKSLRKLNRQISKTQRIKMPPLGLKAGLNFNKMKFFEDKLWAVYDLSGLIRSQKAYCAKDFEVTEPSPGSDLDYMSGFNMGISTFKGLVTSLIAKGGACRSGNLPAGTLPGVEGAARYKIFPVGKVEFSTGRYTYDKSIYEYLPHPSRLPHDPRAPITPDFRLDTVTDDSDDTDTSFQVNLPVKIKFPAENDLSSDLLGIVEINLDFATPKNIDLTSDGYFLMVKEIRLKDLSGSIKTPSIEIPGELLQPYINAELQKERELRVKKVMHPACNPGFSEDDYYNLGDDEDIYFDTNTYFIRDCQSCQTPLDFNPSVMGLRVINHFISGTSYYRNYMAIRSNHLNPKGYAYVENRDCPVTNEEKEDLDDAIIEVDKRMREKLFGPEDGNNRDGGVQDELERDIPIGDELEPLP